jgi:hypothetical protein
MPAPSSAQSWQYQSWRRPGARAQDTQLQETQTPQFRFKRGTITDGKHIPPRIADNDYGQQRLKKPLMPHAGVAQPCRFR